LGTALPILPNENLIFSTKKDIKDSNSNTIQVNMTLATSNSDVSPAIDTERMSALYVQNLLNVVTNSTYKDQYETLATVRGLTNNTNLSTTRYLSRQINLQDGFESTGMDVYLTARLPQGSDLRVYMRSQAKTDNSKFENIPYEPLSVHPTYSSVYGITSHYLSVGEDDYFNIRFSRGGTSVARTSGVTGQTEFRSFQVKVVLYGDYTNYVVPAFKDLKVIAT